jgi:hypothetical protein
MSAVRDQLREAIVARDEAQAAVRKAANHATRADAIVRSAWADVTAFDDLDDRIAGARADSVKFATGDGVMTLDLPIEVKADIAARDDARSAHAAAVVAAAKLDAELDAAQRDLVACAGAVLARVRDVVAEELATKATRLREIESLATPLRQELQAAGRLYLATGDAATPMALIDLDVATRSTIQSPPRLDVEPWGRSARVRDAFIAWAKALRDDADASTPTMEE